MKAQSQKRRVFWFLVVLAVFAVLLSACKDSPSKPEPTEYTKTVTATDGSTTLSGVTFSIDEMVIASDTDAVEITRVEGTTETVVASKAGFTNGSQTITFRNNQNESINLEPSASDPDSVTISYEIRDSMEDTLVTADLLADGSLVGSASSGSFRLLFSETAVELSTDPAFFAATTESVVPNQSASVTLEVDRESVTVSAVAEDENGDQVDSADITVDGEIVGQGAISEQFPARAGQRSISATAPGFTEAAESVSASAEADITLRLEAQAACSDGIDNDGDGKVDQADGGCVANDSPTANPNSPDWIYDPDDESEELRGLGNNFSLPSDDIDFVSSAEGERRDVLIGLLNFPDQIAYAIGEIRISLANQKEAEQDGEAFALEFTCGEDDENFEQFDHLNTTDIVPDDPNLDGWVESPISGITREYFSEGSSCIIYILHATEVRGEPFGDGDGDDDVVTETPEQSGLFNYLFFWEPEEVK